METTLNCNNIQFNVNLTPNKYGDLDVVATNSDGAQAFGRIPGCSTRSYPRIEFSKYNQLRIGGKAGFEHTIWLFEAADKKYHHIGDFETLEEADLRPYDSIEFTLDDETITHINELRANAATEPETENEEEDHLAIGDRVIVNTDKVPCQPWNGFVGDVTEIDEFGRTVLNDARNDDGELWRCRPLAVVQAEWCRLYTPQVKVAPTEHARDFSDSGLGIGGINNDQSMPVIPTVAQIEHAQNLMDTDVVCKRCGASMNFDGAMFTTGGGDICDDCF